MRHSLLLLITLPAMASCVPAVVPPAPPAPPSPAPVAAPPPAPRGVDWRDWTVTPGAWRYDRDTVRRSAATYGAGSAGFLIRLECEPRLQRVTLVTAGQPGEAMLTIRTSTMVRSVPAIAVARPDGSPSARGAPFSPADPLLDAMAFSRGHFVVEETGRPPFVIPAHPEIGRVIEDCRN